MRFEDFAHHQGLSVAWYSVDADFADAHPGLKRVKVAEEDVLSCANTEFKDKKFQNIRTARNKAAKQGVETFWTTWHELDLAVAAKITALSEEWVSDKPLPEMGFTLGGLKEMQVPGTQILYAIDAKGVLHGVTSWLPVRRDGEVVGYTLDVMRRAADGFKGVMELLISEALIIAADRGWEWISLSGAPLAGAAEDPSWLDQALSRVGQELEPLYGFRSLVASKRKFLPEEHPWFLCYDDELKLPAIGLAATNAYLPELNVGQALSAVRTWTQARRPEKEK
ncbi:bifunctional lysylphosphatidylglycerol flippase/synthetase MprF [Corynebacterium confusum]